MRWWTGKTAKGTYSKVLHLMGKSNRSLCGRVYISSDTPITQKRCDRCRFLEAKAKP